MAIFMRVSLKTPNFTEMGYFNSQMVKSISENLSNLSIMEKVNISIIMVDFMMVSGEEVYFMEKEN